MDGTPDGYKLSTFPLGFKSLPFLPANVSFLAVIDIGVSDRGIVGTGSLRFDITAAVTSTCVSTNARRPNKRIFHSAFDSPSSTLSVTVVLVTNPRATCAPCTALFLLGRIDTHPLIGPFHVQTESKVCEKKVVMLDFQ